MDLPVKAPSTAAVATDAAVIVTLREGGGLGPSGTAAHTSPASANADTILLAANTARKGATIYNDSTAVLYVKLGTGASATSYVVQLAAAGSSQSYYEVPFGYTGAVNGFWVSANGNARVVELT